jgi:hypothetical protein
MPDEKVTLTLPLTQAGLQMLIAAVGIALATGLVYLMLHAQGRKPRSDPAMDWLRALGVALVPVWLILLGGTLWHLWLLFDGQASVLGDAGFGMGAVIAAFLGGPFVIWGTVIKQETVKYQKEGHITERISKAVEQLGEEKTVKRDGGEVTVPNIEVRIGGLLSLERIAQDSTQNDKGRDHVRVMEILCAYVRENAPASEASTGPFSTENDVDTIEAKRKSSPHSWIYAQEPPRSDIQIALLIIGRRSKQQRDIEAQYSSPNGKPYQIDLRETNLRLANLEGLNFAHAIFFKSKLEGAFCNDSDFTGANLTYAQLTGVKGRNLSLKNARIEVADFSHALLNNAKISGCLLSHTHFVRTQLKGAHLIFPAKKRPGEVNRAFFIDADLSGALLEGDSNQIVFQWSEKVKNIGAWSKYLGLKNILLGETRWQAGDPLTTVTFSNDFLMTSFGDASVYLPEGADRPQHWPAWQLPDTGAHNFRDEWRKWQADPAGYTPPPPLE